MQATATEMKAPARRPLSGSMARLGTTISMGSDRTEGTAKTLSTSRQVSTPARMQTKGVQKKQLKIISEKVTDDR